MRQLSFFILLGTSLVVACGGGGGGGGGSQPPPPPADFQLDLSPTSVSVPAGGTATTSVSAVAINGFTGQVSVQFSGLPSGVSVSPSAISLTAGTPQTITFSATPTTQPTSVSVVLTGTSAAIQHTADLSLSVTQVVVSALPTRTKYVRTDAVTEYYTALNTHWTVYNAATFRFFVTDPFSNQVFVLDSRTESQIASIPVPGAYGMDDTPDHSTLYVGTLSGDVYTIDPVAMAVTKRYPAATIGPYGYAAISTLVLSDGRVALLGLQGGIPSVDGSTSIAIWNPTNNSIVIYGSASGYAGGSVPSQPLCPMGNIGGYARTGDRVAVLVGSVDSDGTLCELTPSNGQLQSVAIGGFNVTNIFPSPDGRFIVVRSGSGQALFLDAHTLATDFAINLPSNLGSSASSFAFSADSRILYALVSDSTVYVYDIASQSNIGWIPNIVVEYTSGGLAEAPIASPNYEAMDGTGLLGGPTEEGFGFLDTTYVNTGNVGTQFANAFLNPDTGSPAGGTTTQWSVPASVTSQSRVFFGNNPASSVSVSGAFLNVTTPAGVPGPADVYLFTTDGGMQLIPDGFSYGPSILQVSPDLSTAEGGGVGVIYGYGFGPPGATSVPSDLQITVGRQTAIILGFNANAYNVEPIPFLLQSVYYTIPAGTSGSASDVSVTTSSGTAVAKGALTYLPALKNYPLPNAALVQGIYDPFRDVYYFTDANKIQVFSLTQGQWLAPIIIPPPTPTATQRLWGISLSSDGTKLAVADAQAGVVYLVDPANTSSVKSFPVNPEEAGGGILVEPAGVAISNSGIIYMAVDIQGGTGYHNYYTLDTNTGTLTDLGIDGPGLGASDFNLRLAISADGTRVFFNNYGYVFSIDTATGNMVSASVDPGCCYGDYDLTLAPNQIQLEATANLYDANLGSLAGLVLNDRVIQDTSYVYGTKFTPDGTLLFQPSVQGMDIYDGRLGILRSRIAFSEPLSTNYDALASDGKDNILLAITGTAGNGIAVVDLSSIPEPAPLSYSSSALDQSAVVPAASSARESRGNSSDSARKRPVLRAIPHRMNLDLALK